MAQAAKRRSLRSVRLTRKFHWHYMGLWIVLTITLSLALNAVCYQMIEAKGVEIHTLGHHELERYLAERSAYLVGTSIQAVLTIVGIVGLGILTAHRVAGPYMRIIRAFRAVENGEFDHRLRFRTYDHLKDVEDAFNAMMDRIRKGAGSNE